MGGGSDEGWEGSRSGKAGGFARVGAPALFAWFISGRAEACKTASAKIRWLTLRLGKTKKANLELHRDEKEREEYDGSRKNEKKHRI